MTREIKFRCFKEGQMYSDSESKFWLAQGFDKISIEGVFNFMQYTGLHDKNGKEVYEGDILATFEDEDNPNYDGKPSKWIQVIRYDEECAQFIVTEEEVLTVLETTYEPQVADISLGYDEIEVIGNIYEKEKLIK